MARLSSRDASAGESRPHGGSNSHVGACRQRVRRDRHSHVQPESRECVELRPVYELRTRRDDSRGGGARALRARSVGGAARIEARRPARSMIALEHVHARAGKFQLVDITFTVPRGQYGIVIGPAGAGKTTLLETIAGVIPLTSGRVLLEDRDASSLSPEMRGVGIVYQHGY